MALLKIKAKAKIYIVWGNANLSFLREVNDSKNTSVTYSSATGQSFTSGQELYTVGTVGTAGYMSVKSASAQTLNGSGNFNIIVEHYPTSTDGNKTVTFNVSESPINLHLTYNSQPSITDIIVETNNRTTYTFVDSDFISHYSDYDSDAISEIQINGDVTGFKYNSVDYVAGTWINIANVGLLTYNPLDQDAYYEKDVTWKAKDINGNISVN